MADVETVEVTSNGYRSRCLEESAGSRAGATGMCKSVFTEIYDEVGLSGDVVNSVTKWNGQFYFGTDSE